MAGPSPSSKNNSERKENTPSKHPPPDLFFGTLAGYCRLIVHWPRTAPGSDSSKLQQITRELEPRVVRGADGGSRTDSVVGRMGISQQQSQSLRRRRRHSQPLVGSISRPAKEDYQGSRPRATGVGTSRPGATCCLHIRSLRTKVQFMDDTGVLLAAARAWAGCEFAVNEASA